MRKRGFCLGLAAALVAGCHGTGVRELRGAGAERVYEAKCKGSAADCIADTRSTCGSGYTLLDSESHAGGLLADALPGPVTWYAMTFKCDAFGASERPEFPFRGARYVPPSESAPMQQASDEVGHPAPTGTLRSIAPAPTTPPPSAFPTAAKAECRSDFECGSVGMVCVKAQNSFTGTCAKVVNEFGTPTFAPPRPNSIGPGGEGQCAFDTECPIGFKCVKGSALRGNCMK